MSNNKNPKRWRLATAVGLTFISTTVFGWSCPQYITGMVEPNFKAATETINNLINQWDQNFANELKNQNADLLGAMKAMVKQNALSSNQVATTQKNAAQTIASAIGIMTKEEAIKQARFDFGGEFGQGYSPCMVAANRRILGQVSEATKEETAERSTSEVYASAAQSSSPAVVQDLMNKDHAEKYCTADQKSSGLCDVVGDMAGKSLNAGVLFEEAAEGSKTYGAKVAFINNVVGLPVDAIPKSQGNTSAGQAALLAKMNKDAVTSVAITSLKSIQLHYSAVSTGEASVGVSEAALLSKEVKRYSGDTTEYDAWTKVMSGQNERGLLVENLKVKALGLALLAREYEQQEKIEANLATLVSIGARGNDKSKKSNELAKTSGVAGALK